MSELECDRWFFIHLVKKKKKKRNQKKKKNHYCLLSEM